MEELAIALRRYALTLCRDGVYAEDLAQETLARILASSHVPSDITELKPYAFRTLRNFYVDELRKHKVRLEYSSEQERLFSEADDTGFDAVDRLIVRDAFHALNDGQREILFLVDVMGLKYREVADTMQIPAGTVMSRISRARAEMIRHLDETPVTKITEYRKNISNDH